MIFFCDKFLVMIKQHEFNHSSLGKNLTSLYLTLSSYPKIKANNIQGVYIEIPPATVYQSWSKDSSHILWSHLILYLQVSYSYKVLNQKSKRC